jgi:ribosome-binding protein aMBF1 (putative translation factor)
MQSISISEYQPICPEESYSKITELHEKGLSEEVIAEKLAFPLDIVNRYLGGNYTPPSCPELDQSIQPIPKESYNKITELYDEGWSEEEIAEKLELPLDVVHGFISGNYTTISSCPEPYQKSEKNVITEKSMESKPEKSKESITPEETMKKITPEKSMEQWRKEHTVKVKAIRTLKYEQGYLETKEIYTSEEFKKRFGRDNFTKELRIPVSASDAEMIGIREGEERTSVTEEERVFTIESDPPRYWNWYHYPQWCYSEDGGVYTEEDPINMVWENTNKGTVKSEMTEEGWSDIPEIILCQHPFYVNDPVYGWIEGDGVADAFYGLDDCTRILGGYHVRLWGLSTGDVVGQAHRDTHAPHVADQYEPIEELVAGYYEEPDDTQWTVYDDNYPLGNVYTNPHGAYNDGWCTQIYYIIPSLGEAVDNTALSWDTGGRVDWFGQTSTYYYGSDAAQSGTISHNYDSWTKTTVTGPGTLKFYWKVSSEANWDYLEFYIDGVRQDRISGSVNWQQKSYSINSDSHTVKWRYTKDGSVNSGSDCGWLDKVEFTPSGGDLITSKSGTLSGTGSTYTFSVSGYSTVTAVMAGNENADFDLYAKWGSPPTTSDYDARGYSSTSLEYFTTSGSGTLYIMVRSWSGSGHWKCWALSGNPSANSGRKSGTLSGTGDTATYSRSGTGKGYAFNSGPDGSDFDLYIKWNSPPTTSSYDARGYSGWAQEIAGPATGSGTLYFMVRSYSGSGEYATVALIF